MNGWRRTGSNTAPRRCSLPASWQTLGLSKYYRNSAVLQPCIAFEVSPYSGKVLRELFKYYAANGSECDVPVIACTLHQFTYYSLYTFDRMSVKARPLQNCSSSSFDFLTSLSHDAQTWAEYAGFFEWIKRSARSLLHTQCASWTSIYLFLWWHHLRSPELARQQVLIPVASGPWCDHLHL